MSKPQTHGLTATWIVACLALIVGPRFQAADVHVLAAVGLAAISGLVFARVGLRRDVAILIVLYMIGAIYALVVSAWHEFLDVTVAYIAAKSVLYLLGSVVLVAWAEQLFGTDAAVERRVSAVIVLGMIVNSAVVLAVSLSPTVRHALGNVLFLPEKEEWIASGRRSFDLTIGGGAAASAVFAGGFIALWPFVRNQRSVTLLALWLLVPAAAFLMGRTGVVILAAAMPFALLAYLRHAKVRSVTLLRSVAAVGMIGVVAVVFLRSEAGRDSANNFRERVLPWAAEYYYSYARTGQVRTASTDALRSMFFLPEHDAGILFGTSNAGRGDNLPYIPSDVGYVRTIFAVGIVGTIILYVPVVYLLIYGWRRRKSHSGFALAVIACVVLIVNVKELHLGVRSGTAIMSLLFVAATQLRSHRYEPMAQSVRPQDSITVTGASR